MTTALMHIGPFEVRTAPLAGTPYATHTVKHGGVALGSQLSPPVLHECLSHATHACERGVITRATLARIRQLAALTDPSINAPVVRLPRQDKLITPADRTCTKCRRVKAASAFRDTPDGSRKMSWCRECEREYARDRWREKRHPSSPALSRKGRGRF